MIFFGGGGGALALDDGACDPLLFQKGAFSQQQIKHLRGIHITSYSILNVHQVFMHSHELISLVSINCVNNIECYWSRSHSLSATHYLPRVLSDLFLGQCHQLPLLLPLGLHLFTLNR